MNSIQKTMILLLCLILLFTNNITIADTIPDNNAINYRTSEFLGMLAITGYVGKETRLTFPSELNGKKLFRSAAAIMTVHFLIITLLRSPFPREWNPLQIIPFPVVRLCES